MRDTVAQFCKLDGENEELKKTSNTHTHKECSFENGCVGMSPFWTTSLGVC